MTANERREVRPHRFAQTSCSACGRNLGSGNSGTSHCDDHTDDDERHDGYGDFSGMRIFRHYERDGK